MASGYFQQLNGWTYRQLHCRPLLVVLTGQPHLDRSLEDLQRRNKSEEAKFIFNTKIRRSTSSSSSGSRSKSVSRIAAEEKL